MSPPWGVQRKMSKAIASITDENIPGLSAVLNPLELANYLSAVLPSTWGMLGDVEVRVLKLKPGKRCTVDIILQTTTGKHALIGKVYAEDCSDVYRAMKQISQAGFGAGAEFSIPQPFAYIPELQLLLQEKVHGPLAKEIFLAGGERDRTRAAERCARWLAHFQAQAPLSGRVFVLTHKRMESWVRPLTKPNGPLADKARLLLKRLEIASAALDRDETCACHGAYGHHQIILTETRTATFDWDGYCVADPTWDVAQFIIKLQQLGLKSEGSRNALAAAVDCFYKIYTVTSRFKVAKRLPFYKAAHCLKQARPIRFCCH